MRAMGVDPGETTGWAVADVYLGKLEKITVGQIDGTDLLASGFAVDYPTHKYAQYRATSLALMQIIAAEGVDTVIIEDFTLRQMTTTKAEGISPVRIGAMLVVWLYEIMPVEHPKLRVVWQTPSQIGVIHNARMKATMPDAYALTAGLPHARDALRHLEVYRRRRSAKSA